MLQKVSNWSQYFQRIDDNWKCCRWSAYYAMNSWLYCTAPVASIKRVQWYTHKFPHYWDAVSTWKKIRTALFRLLECLSFHVINVECDLDAAQGLTRKLQSLVCRFLRSISITETESSEIIMLFISTIRKLSIMICVKPRIISRRCTILVKPFKRILNWWIRTRNI